jgi:hypothetical protein
LGDPRLEEIISRLDVSDRQRGKLAFVKALDLLPEEERAFIQKLAELRNSLVHNIKNLDFNLKLYLEELDQAQRKAFKGPIISILKGFVENGTEESSRKMFDEMPRGALLVCVIAVTMRVYGHDLELTALSSKPEESSPKEA